MSQDPHANFLREVWFRDPFRSQIRALRHALLTHMLPALPDAEAEAEQLKQALWQKTQSQPSDGSKDSGDFAEWVQDHAIHKYSELCGVRQGATNMAAVALWHMLEQQAMVFLRKEILSSDEIAALNEASVRDRQRIFSWSGFKSLLLDKGVDVRKLQCATTLEELRLVANVAKHATGDSADQLFKRRPDLFTAPGLNRMGFGKRDDANQVAQPAAGEDLYLSEADINTYFDAAESFWDELLGQL